MKGSVGGRTTSRVPLRVKGALKRCWLSSSLSLTPSSHCLGAKGAYPHSAAQRDGGQGK